MREGKGFLLVYSITSRATFDEVAMLRDKILRTKDDENGENIPIVLAGNKCDLEDQRDVTKAEAEKFAKDCNMTFMETSARDKINNVDCFYKVVQLIREMEDKQSANNKQNVKKKKMCLIL